MLYYLYELITGNNPYAVRADIKNIDYSFIECEYKRTLDSYVLELDLTEHDFDDVQVTYEKGYVYVIVYNGTVLNIAGKYATPSDADTNIMHCLVKDKTCSIFINYRMKRHNVSVEWI